MRPVEPIASPSSNDLFDGDILGDELMDIYNAAVVGGDNDEDINEIPSLLGATEIADGENKDGNIDDGFGAFRPSTSFNDLYSSAQTTTAINLRSDSSSSNTKSTVNAAVIRSAAGVSTTMNTDVLSSVVSSTSLSPNQVVNPQTDPGSGSGRTSVNTINAAAVLSSPVIRTKRKTAANANIGASAPKRRVSSGRKISTASSRPTSPGNNKSLKKKNGINNTPNPLALTSLLISSDEKGTTTAAASSVHAATISAFSVSATASTKPIVTNEKETTKTYMLPIKVESVIESKPSVLVTPPSDSVFKLDTSTIPVVNTSTHIRTAISDSLSTSADSNKNVSVFSKAKTNSSISVVSASVLSNPPTEADFKSVAQAAVNNLIMNVGSNNKNNIAKTCENKFKQEPSSSKLSSTSPSPSVTTMRVNTSTKHVKALTGSNWVAVCGGGNSISNNVGGIGGDNSNKNSTNNLSSNDKNFNRARRSNLTPDERARQNRDRNREHARNTRLRKKAYVEELKATLSALVAQRDAADLERRHASQRELEQREVRFRVLEEFLKLRGRNEANPARWTAILEDKFRLTLPITDFRDMVHRNRDDFNESYEQVLTGVTDVMHDSTLCSTFLQSLVGKSTNEIVALSYNCDRDEFFMDNCVATLDWTATTAQRSSLKVGTVTEVILKGQIQAKFSPASNKIISAVMRFDTSAVISQIKRIVKLKESSEENAAEAAAQVAANEADALLDSLQMPHFDPPTTNSGKINYVPPSSVSSTNSEDNSDDDKDEIEDNVVF